VKKEKKNISIKGWKRARARARAGAPIYISSAK